MRNFRTLFLAAIGLATSACAGHATRTRSIAGTPGAAEPDDDRVVRDPFQSLATWGWRDSSHLVLPVFGPRTVRDAFGMPGDPPLSALAVREWDRMIDVKMERATSLELATSGLGSRRSTN